MLEWTEMGWNMLKTGMNRLKYAGIGWNMLEYAGICRNMLE